MTFLIYMIVAAYNLDWFWFLGFQDWAAVNRGLFPLLVTCSVSMDVLLYKLWRVY